MNKKEFIEIIGENPEDVFGCDWENELRNWEENDTKRQ
jgi:hypothetical protein